VVVSAVFPVNACTSSGNPFGVTSSPTTIWGSTRLSLLIPTFRRSSSSSATKYKVVTS